MSESKYVDSFVLEEVCAVNKTELPLTRFAIYVITFIKPDGITTGT
jgi:hypothetical protein